MHGQEGTDYPIPGKFGEKNWQKDEVAEVDNFLQPKRQMIDKFPLLRILIVFEINDKVFD